MIRNAAHPLLLTPGPVSVSRTTREAMMIDRSAGDADFQADVAFVRDYLVGLVDGRGAYCAIPLPGSATYANEAVLATLVPAGGKVLIHTNGVYGDRLIEICAATGTAHAVLRTPPFAPATGDAFEAALRADGDITHVMVVHCETSTGILNPLEPAAAACRRHGKGLLVDAVASFGAMTIDARSLGFHALTLSSNKCMQGVPGVGWAIVQNHALEAARGVRRTLSLDLWDQNQHMDRTGTFRFTPPTHVVAAFAQACREHAAEGGSPARLDRYRRNWRRLVDGMRQMGFSTVVPDDHASPIVATFHEPADPAFAFEALYQGMKRRGFVIFPGRLAIAGTFRIACMGDVAEHDIADAMSALAETLAEMGMAGFGRLDPATGRPHPAAIAEHP